MRKFILLLMLAMVTAAPVTANEEAAGAHLHQYFAAFNDKDVDRIAHSIYSTPVQIGGGSGHRVYTNPADAIENLNRLYKQIEAQGWVESRIENLQVCVLSDTVALVDTRYSRIDQDGNPIAPAIRTTLYVLQKIDDAWGIVAFYGHDNEHRPAC
ncbi:MAG: YybH family protein [Woeseiaceae bacterium]